MDNSPKGVLTCDRERLPAWHMGVLLPDPRAVEPRTRTLGTIQNLWTTSDQCQNSNAPRPRLPETERKWDAYHSWFRYRICSLTDLPPAVRDVGNDRLCYRFLVSRAGRSHAFPASRSTNGPSVVLSLSLSLAVLTLCSEFTHPPRNRISSLPLSHSLRSRNPSTAHPLLWGYDGFLFDSREHQFTKFVPALGLHLC